MKLTFIGTSHGYPEPNRKCSCLMLEIGERVYFVDMGSSAVDALHNRGRSMAAVKSVFITHPHGDHMDGLFQFVRLLMSPFKEADPEIWLPLPEVSQVITAWMQLIRKGYSKEIRYRTVTPGTFYDDGVLKVTAFPTQHCEKSHGYLLEAEGKRVLITGDLKNPAIDFPGVTGALDLLVCESAHFQATQYLPILEKVPAARVCVTHYYEPFIPSVLELVRILEGRGIPAAMATDGLEVRI